MSKRETIKINTSEITTIEQLDQAQNLLNARIAQKRRSIAGNFESAKEFYTPANLLNTAIRDAAPMFDIRKTLLGIVRNLKNRL